MSDKVPPLYGLVLAGGQSQRMQQDKWRLDYHGVSQLDHGVQLLSSLCQKVYVSCRSDQKELLKREDLYCIEDLYPGMGPLAGILSAQQTCPDVAWLVLACDLPFVTEQILDHLFFSRQSTKVATCYRNEEKGFPEPLCTIYEPESHQRFQHFLEKGHKCPRKMLMNSDVMLLDIPESGALDNINTPAEQQQVRDRLP